LLRSSAKTAFGGILAAISISMMLLTAVIPFMQYALPSLAGGLLVLAVIELNKKWAAGIYTATSLLALFIVADKDAALMYVLFFGYYPIIKAVFEKNCPKWLARLLKFLVFNASVAAENLLLIYVFHIPFEEMKSLGKWAIPAMFLLMNIILILYDNALALFISLYNKKLRKGFHKLFK